MHLGSDAHIASWEDACDGYIVATYKRVLRYGGTRQAPSNRVVRVRAAAFGLCEKPIRHVEQIK